MSRLSKIEERYGHCDDNPVYADCNDLRWLIRRVKKLETAVGEAHKKLVAMEQSEEQMGVGDIQLLIEANEIIVEALKED